MNRTATVFTSVLATLIGLLGIYQGVAHSTSVYPPITEGYIGGTLSFGCGVICTLMFLAAFRKSEAEIMIESSEVQEKIDGNNQ